MFLFHSKNYAFLVFLSVIWAIAIAAQTFNPADLDTSFGTNGKVTTDFSGSTDAINANSLVVLADGKILAAGIASNATNDFALALYHKNGTLDTTFGTNGKVTTDFFNGGDYASGLAVLADGKILAAGVATNGTNANFALVRYQSNGTLDTTFGTSGKVHTDFFGGPDGGVSIAVLNDGKILVAGDATNASGNFDFALARYNADGSIDTTFGINGKANTDFAGLDDRIVTMLVLADGKILLSGYVYTGPNHYGALARYQANGTLDTTFGTNGKVISDLHVYNGILVLPDGKIVAGGSVMNGPYLDFVLARYSANGVLDTTFGTGGKVTTDFFGSHDQINALKLLPNGKILAAGSVSVDAGGVTLDFGLACYNTDGTLYTSFGTNGKTNTDFGSAQESPGNIDVQSDGKILVGGWTGTNRDFAISRYMGDYIPPKITLQIGALPKAQAGLSEYLLKLPFGATPQDVTVSMEWDDASGALLRLKRQWPAARGEEKTVTRGLSTLNVVYKNIAGNLDLVIKHQPAVGTNPGSGGHARNIIVKIFCTTLPTSITLTPWIGDPGIGGLPFVHKLGLSTAPTHFTSEYPTGANVTEQINATPSWEWIMNDATTSFLTYPAEIKVDWQ